MNIGKTILFRFALVQEKSGRNKSFSGSGKAQGKSQFFYFTKYEKTKNFIFSLTQLFANYSFIRKERCVRFVVKRLWCFKSLGNKRNKRWGQDSVQNMPKEIRNSKPYRKFRKSRFSSLSNEYYLVLKIVFVFLGPAVWPSVWFVRWTNSYSTRAYYTQQTWQCKGGSQGKTGLFVFSRLFSSSSVFFLLAFRLSPSSLLFFVWNNQENKLHNKTNLNSLKSVLTLSSGLRDLR